MAQEGVFLWPLSPTEKEARPGESAEYLSGDPLPRSLLTHAEALGTKTATVSTSPQSQKLTRAQPC